ncbi:outer membrane beta-barrel protein [Helicobacter cetorum]|nr:outer membrane beta-barrel protein [Helicobacter cetorum]
MRALLIVLLSFISLKAEKSSWYAGGSFLIGQGEQKRTITTLEPSHLPPVMLPPNLPKQTPQNSPVSSKGEPSGKSKQENPSPQPVSSPPHSPPPQQQHQEHSPQEKPAELPPNPQPQVQDPPPEKSSPIESPNPQENPTSKSKPTNPPQPRAENQPDINQQVQNIARQDYTEKVIKYRTDKDTAMDNASQTGEAYTRYTKWCVKNAQRYNDQAHNCISIWGKNAHIYEVEYNKIFNEHTYPNAVLPNCPMPSGFPMPSGYNENTLAEKNCFEYGNADNIITTSMPTDIPNLANYFYRLLTLQTNRYTQTNLSNLVSVSKQTTLHYGVSLAIGYKHFFVPRFGLRTYANIEYLYTNAYFSNSNILYGGGLDFLANIIDNNDKQSMIFGIFAGVNLAGNTSIAQIKDNHVSNTQFNTFLHTGLRFVFNGMHEFDLGVKVPFLKNPSVSLNTSNKLYEVQNNTLYSMFISYYYLF